MHLLVLVAALMLMAACTTSAPVDPAAPAGVQLPPRPREVRLDGVDPCSLLTAEQRAELGLTGDPRRDKSYVSLFRGVVDSCTISGPAPESPLLGISAVTTAGIERWQEGDLAVSVNATTVADFPALVARPTQFSDYCSVEVDVASGQLMEIQFGAGSQHPSRQEDYCVRATGAAARVMTTLLRA